MSSALREAILALPAALSAVPPPSAASSPRWPVVVLVGAPRSGTTLAYQMIARHLRCAYVTNLQAALYGAPWLLAAPVAWSRPWRRIGFGSRYGRTDGWWGPHEGARYWGRFFAPDGGGDLRRMAAELRAWTRFAHAPLVCKNVMHVSRMEALAAALPEARFVRVERDALAVARSLLRARRDRCSDEAEWFSLRPPGWEAVADATPAEQVAAQVALCERELDRATRAIGSHRVHALGYGQLCASPAAALRGVARFIGGSIIRRGLRGRPRPQVERSGSLDPDSEVALSEALGRWGVSGG